MAGSFDFIKQLFYYDRVEVSKESLVVITLVCVLSSKRCPWTQSRPAWKANMMWI